MTDIRFHFEPDFTTPITTGKVTRDDSYIDIFNHFQVDTSGKYFISIQLTQIDGKVSTTYDRFGLTSCNDVVSSFTPFYGVDGYQTILPFNGTGYIALRASTPYHFYYKQHSGDIDCVHCKVYLKNN